MSDYKTLEPEAVEEEICRICKTTIFPDFILTPTLPHYGKFVCPACHAMLRWAKKPKNEGKRSGNKYFAKFMKVTRCQMCQRTQDMLGLNEGIDCHHVIAINQGGEDELDNIWWVCTSCHKEIHDRRVYLMEHHLDKFNLSDLKELIKTHNVQEESAKALESLFKKYQAERKI